MLRYYLLLTLNEHIRSKKKLKLGSDGVRDVLLVSINLLNLVESASIAQPSGGFCEPPSECERRCCCECVHLYGQIELNFDHNDEPNQRLQYTIQ